MKKVLMFFVLILLFKAEAQSGSVFPNIQKADTLYEIGDYSNAIAQYKQLTFESSIAAKIAKAYEALGNVPEALHYYEKAASESESTGRQKENIRIKLDFAKLLAQSSKYKKADSIFRRLTDEFPNNPNFIYQRALIKEALNDSTAIEYFKQVFLLDTNHIKSVYKIGRNYIENRKFMESELFVNKGLSVDSTSTRFLNLLALKQFYTKDCHAAISTYNRLISLEENNIQIHENLASCYSYTNQFEKSLDQYKILLQEFDDKNPKWHVGIATLYRSLKEYKKAERHMNIAIALQEIPLSESYLELAAIYKGKGDYKSELKVLKSALLNNPSNEMALFRMAVAADNYFADKKVVLRYYEDYLKKYSKNGRMRNLSKQRVADLKKELHFSIH